MRRLIGTDPDEFGVVPGALSITEGIGTSSNPKAEDAGYSSSGASPTVWATAVADVFEVRPANGYGRGDQFTATRYSFDGG